ncbi:hypothetical protein FFI89_029040 [Bradyrhizobium sp. KBS0727]|uniref:hypothetical protein n=1 Tax=unclassified Bradyrhizobium TaxID=2631580 RepID=UPI00110DE433|nr:MULTISPECIES: hypothetical protein [unclassified Bradyrhizobium]QDW40816.1 hypothetical protein FFI71_029045 [Bradyrhizobium sp. KBS0725]QDW47422.1 hypothetical protein FFI89_029040 [Bradyrhizobium sp. KBS0727]
MTIDIFSLKAVENISTSIENWKKQLKTALENLQDADALPDEVNPKLAIQFAGYPIPHAAIMRHWSVL